MTIVKTTLGRGGSQWRRSAPSQVSAVRLQQQNIVKIRAGLTAFSASHILRDSPIYRVYVRNIQKCTIAEAHRAIENNNSKVTLDELDKFVGLIVARGIFSVRAWSIKSMWDKFWGCPLFNATMPCWKSFSISDLI